jgi:hypothetical protein
MRKKEDALNEAKSGVKCIFINMEIKLYCSWAFMAYEMIFFDKMRALKPSKKAMYFCNIAEKCNFRQIKLQKALKSCVFHDTIPYTIYSKGEWL